MSPVTSLAFEEAIDQFFLFFNVSTYIYFTKLAKENNFWKDDPTILNWLTGN